MRVAKAIAYGMYLRITKVCLIFGSILVSSDIPIYLIFDVQMLLSEHIIDGSSGEVAVDHYHRYKVFLL
jgi:hypothetical protein